MKNKFNIVFKRLKKAGLGENVLCAKLWQKLIKLHQNFDEELCWAIFMENIAWLINNNIITPGNIKTWFSIAELNKHHIYTSGSYTIKDSLAIGFGDVKFKALGHSRVLLFENAFCTAFDTTFVTGFQDSFFIVTDCLGQSFHHSKVIAKGLAKVEARDESYAKAESYSYIISYDNSTVEKSGKSYSIHL